MSLILTVILTPLRYCHVCLQPRINPCVCSIKFSCSSKTFLGQYLLNPFQVNLWSMITRKLCIADNLASLKQMNAKADFIFLTVLFRYTASKWRSVGTFVIESDAYLRRRDANKLCFHLCIWTCRVTKKWVREHIDHSSANVNLW